MTPSVCALLALGVSLVRSRVSLQEEILALRHQLAIYDRSIRRPRVRRSDRIFRPRLVRHRVCWREAPVFVQPATMLAWRRTRFRDPRTRLSRKRPVRPAISRDIRALSRKILGANPRMSDDEVATFHVDLPDAVCLGSSLRVLPSRLLCVFGNDWQPLRRSSTGLK